MVFELSHTAVILQAACTFGVVIGRLMSFLKVKRKAIEWEEIFMT